MMASDLHLIREKCNRAMIAYGLVPALGLLLALASLLAAQRAPQTSYAAALAAPLGAATATSGGYDMGNPVLQDIFVSPEGRDTNSGITLTAPLKTLTAAWAQIPQGLTLSVTGYRINLLPGVYPCEPGQPNEMADCQNYFANVWGTYTNPVVLRAYDGPRTVTLRGGMDVADVKYFYLLDMTLAGGGLLPTNISGNNLLHLAGVDHVLLRGVTLQGPDCPNDTCNNLQETLKVNQAQYLYVENSEVGGAWHTVVDYFAVQYGHFLNNRLHTAGQWCMYVKGGSAYLRLEGNELYQCQLGFEAGQSANLPVMVLPWAQYEAYDVKFVNNILHDVPGTGLSVSGGYNVLFAYNTLYHVGYDAQQGHPLFEAVPGERGCSATDEWPDPQPRCLFLLGQGAWGPNIVTDDLPAIPNRNVYVYNNLFYNAAPARTLYTQFEIRAPASRPASFPTSPDPVTTDNNLVFAGNLIWNGPADQPLGIDETTGCQPDNPTCSETQLVLSNTINTLEPQLANPLILNFRPLLGGNVLTATTYPVPDFGWDNFTPTVPAGTLNNSVGLDRDGNGRNGSGPPGAYAVGAVDTAHHVYLPLVRTK